MKAPRSCAFATLSLTILLRVFHMLFSLKVAASGSEMAGNQQHPQHAHHGIMAASPSRLCGSSANSLVSQPTFAPQQGQLNLMQQPLAGSPSPLSSQDNQSKLTLASAAPCITRAPHVVISLPPLSQKSMRSCDAIQHKQPQPSTQPASAQRPQVRRCIG